MTDRAICSVKCDTSETAVVGIAYPEEIGFINDFHVGAVGIVVLNDISQLKEFFLGCFFVAEVERVAGVPAFAVMAEGHDVLSHVDIEFGKAKLRNKA